MSNKVSLSFGPPEVSIDRRADGSMIVRSTGRLKPYVRAVPDWLEHWAHETPNHVFLGERQGETWREVTYAQARQSARSIAQALLNRGLSAERPVAILSGNSIDHALIGLGAMMAGLPYSPVSPPYSLVAKDFAKLRAIMEALTPGLVFVNDGRRSSRRSTPLCRATSRSSPRAIPPRDARRVCSPTCC